MRWTGIEAVRLDTNNIETRTFQSRLFYHFNVIVEPAMWGGGILEAKVDYIVLKILVQNVSHSPATILIVKSAIEFACAFLQSVSC